MKLWLDLSVSKVSKVKLLDGEKVVDELVGGNTLALIDEILGKNHLKLPDLDEVDSFPGPGSFTGLKIGAAIANTLNFVLGKKKRITPTYGEEVSKLEPR